MALLALSAPAPARADPRSAVTVGMAREPSGLDPTTSEDAAIGQIAFGNIFEGLVRLEPDFSVSGVLARSWSLSPDRRTLKFYLRLDARFQDGREFSSADVKFSFERAAAAGSRNPDAAFFRALAAVDAPSPDVVALRFKRPRFDALYHLARQTAAIVDERGADAEATTPVGTGPFRLASWNRSASIVLEKWPRYRDSGRIGLERATFRFVADPIAEVAALRSDDIDVFPDFTAYAAIAALRAEPRFQILVGASARKWLLAIDGARPPLGDLRVRQALAYGVDRGAVGAAAADGFAKPLGSHAASLEPGYADLTAEYRHDPGKAAALLRDAGVALPLKLSLGVPAIPGAGEAAAAIAAQLARVGVEAKFETLAPGEARRGFDLELAVYPQPLDLARYAATPNEFGYESSAMRAIAERLEGAPDLNAFKKAMGAAQVQLSEDCVNVFLYEEPFVTIADARLAGLARDAPTAAFDLSAISWR